LISFFLFLHKTVLSIKMKKEVSWFLTIVITAYVAMLQLIMESAYPIITEVNTGKQKINVQLIRSYEGDKDCPIILPIEDIAVKGYLIFNLKSDSVNQKKIDLKREGDNLIGYLPAQIPSTDVEYRVFLEREKTSLVVNDGKPITIKFKGKVPHYLIFSNGLLITLVILLSNLTGFFAVFGIKSYRWMIYLTLISFLFLNFFLHPLVQKYSLNNWSYSLTVWSLNSKIFFASLIWMITLLLFQRKNYRLLPIFASIITVVIFLIPHHTVGEEPVKITLDLLERNFLTLLQLF